MYSTICVADHFGLTQIDPLLTNVCAKNDFYIFVPFDLLIELHNHSLASYYVPILSGRKVCDRRTDGLKMSQKRSISADEMYLMISVDWAADHFGLGLT